MTKEEYMAAFKEAGRTHDDAIAAIKRKYIADMKDEDTVQAGDIIKDHIGAIEVDHISVGFFFGNDLPEMKYSGVMVTRNGKGAKYKSGARRTVFKRNMENKK